MIELKKELPLKGVRVLDLTHVLSGPYLTMMMGDFGAEIIKIEKPGRGDTTRGTTPFINGVSHYFLAVNRNKYSLTLDMKKEKGKELFFKLVEKSDVVVNNFRPGVMENLGLGYEKMKEVNKKIINCGISGFGQLGQLKEKTAFDLISQAMSGIMSVTGEIGGSPIRCGVSIGDTVASTFAFAAIMMALYKREMSEEGENIDISMLDCLTSYLTYFIPLYQATGRVPKPMGSMHASVTPMGAFKAKDGYIVIAAFNQKFWINLCKAINKEEHIDDPRFIKMTDRQKNRTELMELIEKEINKETSKYWLEKFDEYDVPCGPVLNIAEAVQLPTLLERNMILELKHSKAGSVKVANQPIKLSGIKTNIMKEPPGLGEDTRDILTKLLEIPEAEYKIYKETNVI